MNTVCTIECRMSSSRLPGKVLMPFCGKPALQLMIERVARAPEIDQIVVATTTNGTDDEVAGLADRLGIGCFRGSEEDVLARVLGAAQKYGGDTIVELTGDCPLVDPTLISQGINTYRINECDYFSNGHVPGYPIGLDVQVFSTRALEISHREGLTPEDREHVSWYIRRFPDRFRHVYLAPPTELHWPDLRLTLDEPADYEFLTVIFEHLYLKKPDFSALDILEFLRANPQHLAINANVKEREIGAAL